jgi:hypothetical protein
VPFETRKEISSILEFFGKRDALPRLRSWVEPVRAGLGEKYLKQEDIFACKTRRARRCYQDYDLPRDIMSAWGMTYVDRWDRDDKETTNLHVNAPSSIRGDNRIIRIAPYAYMVSFYVYKRHDNKENPSTFQLKNLSAPALAPFEKMTAQLSNDSQLIVKTDTGAEAVFDLAHLATWADETRTREMPIGQVDKLHLTPVTGNLIAEFRVESFNAGLGEMEGKEPIRPWRILNVRGDLLFSLPE